MGALIRMYFMKTDLLSTSYLRIWFIHALDASLEQHTYALILKKWKLAMLHENSTI